MTKAFLGWAIISIIGVASTAAVRRPSNFGRPAGAERTRHRALHGFVALNCLYTATCAEIP
jgi:hypothetical protein